MLIQRNNISTVSLLDSALDLVNSGAVSADELEEGLGDPVRKMWPRNVFAVHFVASQIK